MDLPWEVSFAEDWQSFSNVTAMEVRIAIDAYLEARLGAYWKARLAACLKVRLAGVDCETDQ